MSIAKHDQTSMTFIEGMPLLEYCKFISNSQLIPKSYKGKPEDIFLAIIMGKEIGLKPLQALKSISVINSVPNIYGDAAISLVQAHPQFEDIKEYFDEKLQAAICIIKRKHQSEHMVAYSIEDAKKAGLWGKVGPWQQYARRMLQMRARGFALRDRFADALGGLILAEEAQDYPVDVNQKTKTINTKLDEILINQLQSIESNEAKNIEENIFVNNNESIEYSKLVHLIKNRNVPEEIISKWCTKANVETLEELDEDKIQSCIQFIETKFIDIDHEKSVVISSE